MLWKVMSTEQNGEKNTEKKVLYECISIFEIYPFMYKTIMTEPGVGICKTLPSSPPPSKWFLVGIVMN